MLALKSGNNNKYITTINDNVHLLYLNRFTAIASEPTVAYVAKDIVLSAYGWLPWTVNGFFLLCLASISIQSVVWIILLGSSLRLGYLKAFIMLGMITSFYFPLGLSLVVAIILKLAVIAHLLPLSAMQFIWVVVLSTALLPVVMWTIVGLRSPVDLWRKIILCMTQLLIGYILCLVASGMIEPFMVV
ncbi:MAG: hypothetical protein GXW96_03050 [Christensenellaceae bacterium]|nr:hypothetical protein [Christensenellaceae bacterium]